MNYQESLERYKNYLRLRKEGASYSDIAAMYGITRQAVQDRIKRGEPKFFEAPEGSILGKLGYGHLDGRDRARMLVRLRDNFTCQDCGLVRTSDEVVAYNKKQMELKGKIKQLDVHHTHGQCGKNSIGYDSPKDISKMITLCHRCHFNRPEHKTKKEAAKRRSLGIKTQEDVLKAHKDWRKAKFGL